MSDGPDFFVSYTSVDTAWAKWIAWTLEKDGNYKTWIQAWDFAAGNNFVLKMAEAVELARHTVAVLSPAYLRSEFTASEWTAAFARDPGSNDRRLIPVMVETCEPGGLLKQISHIRLVGLDEASARDALLQGVSGHTGIRPLRPPVFPGARGPKDPAAPPAFPGRDAAAATQERRTDAAEAEVTHVPSRPEHPVAKPAPADLHTPDPVPWLPLSASPAVQWETDLNMAAGGPEVSRLELHVIPVPSGSSATKPDFSAVRNALVVAGRRNEIFPSTGTVSVEAGVDHVTAVLAASAGAAEAGLRVDETGERSGWLCLPPAGTSDIAMPVTAALGRLLAALVNLPLALPEEITFAAAISGQAKLPPRNRLRSRDLAAHAQQVVAQLGSELTGEATDGPGSA